MRPPLPAHLTTISNPRALLAVALDWALIAACFVAAIRFSHPLVFLLSAILIARTQLALAVLMHESAHGTLLSYRRLNDIAGQLFAAAPLLLVMDFYRSGHLQHHRAPMVADDPVATIFGIDDYPVTRRELVWRLFKDATGIGYLLSARNLVRTRQRRRSPPYRPAVAGLPAPAAKFRGLKRNRQPQEPAVHAGFFNDRGARWA